MEKDRFNLRWFLDVWRLARIYWTSEERRSAWLLLVLIVVLNLGNVYLQVLFNHWNVTFYNAIQNYDYPGFIHAIKLFTVLVALFVLVAGAMIYLQMMLKIRWRRWMTRHYVSRWLGGKTYYRMNLLSYATDNPDQRISEDIRLFIDRTLDLTIGLLVAVTTLGSFLVILWRLSGVLSFTVGGIDVRIPGYMVWMALAYALTGTWLTTIIGRPLIRIEFLQQRYEADFRFVLMRLRENIESIAFYDGEDREQARFVNRFRYVVSNYYQMMNYNMALAFFRAGYNVASAIFAILVAAPRYFAREFQFGQLMQVANAYSQVHQSLSFIVDSFTEIAEWRAVAQRLSEFAGHMEQARSLEDGFEELCRHEPSDGPMAMSDLDICLPDGRLLIRGLEMTVDGGETLLVAGPSGCGKSTLLRTLAGLWPFGRGSVTVPEDALFVPQHSYLPIDSLREAVLYPGAATDGATDEEIKAVLHACRLEHLAGRLDETADWPRVLSGGEQQRLAFARVLLQKPKWLFLDEATSALDESTETHLYQVLRDHLPETTIISVGHRHTLTRFHHQVLRFTDDAQWALAAGDTA